MPAVTNTVRYSDNTPAQGRIVVRLLKDGAPGVGYRTANDYVTGYSKLIEFLNGSWSITLDRNTDLTPANTYWEIIEQVLGPGNMGAASLVGQTTYTLQVPSSGAGPFWVYDILITPPSAGAGPGGGSGSITAQDEGSALTPRAVLNFTGAGVTATDDPTNQRTNVTITGGGSAGYQSIQSAGTPVTQRTILNVTGPGVTVTDDAGGTRTTLNITGGGYDTIQDEGAARTQRAILNFLGQGVSVADNPAGPSTDVSVNGLAGAEPVAVTGDRTNASPAFVSLLAALAAQGVIQDQTTTTGPGGGGGGGTPGAVTDLAAALRDVVPGQTLILSGTYTGTFKTSAAGTETNPIKLVGDGTAKIQASGLDSGSALAINHDYYTLDNIEITGGARGLDVQNAKWGQAKNLYVHDVGSQAYRVRGTSDHWYFVDCRAEQTGLSTLNLNGEGWLIGTPSDSWADPLVPEPCEYITLQRCTASNLSTGVSDGIDIKEGARFVAVLDSTVDFAGGAPPDNGASGDDGVSVRTNDVLVKNTIVRNNPGSGAAYKVAARTANDITYGNRVWFKQVTAESMGGFLLESLADTTGVLLFDDYTDTATAGVTTGGGTAGRTIPAAASYTDPAWLFIPGQAGGGGGTGDPTGEPPATLFVSTSGSDAASGKSASAPFKTLQKALDVAVAGDVIQIADGTYTGTGTVTKRSGTADKPIVVRSENPRGAIFQGGAASPQGTPQPSGRVLEPRHNWYRWRGLHVRNADKLIYASAGASNNIFEDLLLEVSGGESFRLHGNCNQNEIRYCTIRRNGRDNYNDSGQYDSSSDNGEAIYIGTSPSQVDGVDNCRANWVHHCRFENVGSEAVNIKEGSQENVVEHCDAVSGGWQDTVGNYNSQGENNTFRWNRSQHHAGWGARLGLAQPRDDGAAAGVNNHVYGNEFTGGNALGGVKIQNIPQGRVCGNTGAASPMYGGTQPGAGTTSCPAGTPSGTPDYANAGMRTYSSTGGGPGGGPGGGDPGGGDPGPGEIADDGVTGGGLRTVNVSTGTALKNAVTGALNGDEIVIASGTYSGLGFFSLSGKSNVTIRAATTSAAIISSGSTLEIKGCTNVKVVGIKFVLGGTANSLLKITDSTDTRTERCTFDGNNQSTGSADLYVVTGTSKKWRVTRCKFMNKHDLGGNYVYIYGTSTQVVQDGWIDYNHFIDIGPQKENEQEAILYGWSGISRSSARGAANRGIVEHNLFEQCDGDPEVISVKCDDVTVRYNTWRDCQGTAVVQRHGRRGRIYGNWFFGGTDLVRIGGGVRFYDVDHWIFNNYFQDFKGSGFTNTLSIEGGDRDSGTDLTAHWRVHRATVVHNTIVNCTTGLIIGDPHGTKYPMPPVDCIVKDNLVVGSASGPLYNQLSGTNIAYAGNLGHATGSATLKTSNITSGVTAGDPGMTLISGVYRPATSGPHIGSASTAHSMVTDDIDGETRPSSGRDVGADEVPTGTPSRTPKVAADVGPAS